MSTPIESTEGSAGDERQIDRRTLLVASGAALAGLVTYPLVRRAMRRLRPFS